MSWFPTECYMPEIDPDLIKKIIKLTVPFHLFPAVVHLNMRPNHKVFPRLIIFHLPIVIEKYNSSRQHILNFVEAEDKLEKTHLLPLALADFESSVLGLHRWAHIYVHKLGDLELDEDVRVKRTLLAKILDDKLKPFRHTLEHIEGNWVDKHPLIIKFDIEQAQIADKVLPYRTICDGVEYLYDILHNASINLKKKSVEDDYESFK